MFTKMNCKSFFVMFLLTGVILSAQTNKIIFVENHSSEYKIVISGSASYWDSLAATEFQKYIKEISGTEIPIVNDSATVASREIVIGKNNRSKNISLSSVHDDGFIIKTEVEKVYLIGGGKKGTLYSVYTFLEKYLDCRMYSASVKVIPTRSSIVLPKIDIVENPAFAYRDIYYYENTFDEYCHWHKLIDSEKRDLWGLSVHTLHLLL